MNFKRYKNGNVDVLIGSDGTKIRYSKADYFAPSFAESMDIKITDRCSQGCPFCYEGCTRNGSHGKLSGWRFLESLHPYTEMALNGNDLDHPEFENFLKEIRGRDVYPNITVNQRQFTENFEKIRRLKEECLIYGIGVSIQEVDEDFIKKINMIPDIVIHSIVGIINEDTIKRLMGENIKLLILGYKTLQRGQKYKEGHNKEIEANRQYLKDNIKEIFNYFNIVSFDNLALEQLDIKSKVSKEEWEKYYMGDDGEFTFYIDLVKGEFARNSISNIRFPIGDLTVDEMFKKIREI